MNIGALVCLPDSNILKYHFSFNEKRIMLFDPAYDESVIEKFEELLDTLTASETFGIYNEQTGKMEQKSVCSMEFLNELARMNASSKIQFSDVNWVDFEIDKIQEEDLRTFLGDLIKKYVQVKAEKYRSTQRPSAFKTEVRDELKKRKLIGKDIKEHRIVENYKLQEFDWAYDFALQNKVLHLYETVDLSKTSMESTTRAALKETALPYMKFLEAKELFRGRNQRVDTAVLLKITYDREKVFEKEIELLRKNSNSVFNLHSRDEKKKFIAVVEESVGDRRFLE